MGVKFWSRPPALFLLLSIWKTPMTPIHTVDGSEIPNNHLGCKKKTYNSWGKLPTSTGKSWISEPSTVWNEVQLLTWILHRSTLICVSQATPLARLGEPEDTAAAVAFLCILDQEVFFGYPPVNQHSNGKSTICRCISYRWWISHCYVSLPEGTCAMGNRTVSCNANLQLDDTTKNGMR